MWIRIDALLQSFSKDTENLDTMSMHDPGYKSSAGSGSTPSFKDVYIINKVYCDGRSYQLQWK